MIIQKVIEKWNHSDMNEVIGHATIDKEKMATVHGGYAGNVPSVSSDCYLHRWCMGIFKGLSTKE
jgi:hypothetical protein